jgi:hypothetical protein
MLFQTVSRELIERKSLDKCMRMWLIPLRVDSNTGTTKGSPFFPGGQGNTPTGVAVTVERSFGRVES